jgi:hypothetical protein
VKTGSGFRNPNAFLAKTGTGFRNPNAFLAKTGSGFAEDRGLCTVETAGMGVECERRPLDVPGIHGVRGLRPIPLRRKILEQIR